MNGSFFRTMRFQTVAILAVGFFASHLISLLLYHDDRRDALLITEATDIAERAAGVSVLLRSLPATWREEVIEVSNSRAFRVWRSNDPVFDSAAPSETELELAEYILSQLPHVSGSGLHVRFTEPEQIWREIREAQVESPNLYGFDMDFRNIQAVGISVQRVSGDWLNFLGQVNNPKTLLPGFLSVNLLSSALAIALVAFWLVNRVTKPLLELSKAAERLGKNIQARPLKVQGSFEVATAAGAFNRMQGRLLRLIEGRTGFLAAVSHDLRTPITQIRLRTEMMPASVDRDKNLKALDEMEGIIETFLRYSSAVSEAETRSRSDLGALVESICDDFVDAGANIDCVVHEKIVLECKHLSIKRAISNLVDNALKYGGSASVSVHREESSAVVVVRDNGPGIAEDALQFVFQPFYRSDQARSRSGEGVGLGLSIAQAIVEDHGGEVRLVNSDGGGLEAKIILPL